MKYWHMYPEEPYVSVDDPTVPLAFAIHFVDIGFASLYIEHG